jgi:hypothetical protein
VTRPARDPRDRLTITLVPVGKGPPAAVRFRRVLKLLLRGFGLRASWPEQKTTRKEK